MPQWAPNTELGSIAVECPLDCEIRKAGGEFTQGTLEMRQLRDGEIIRLMHPAFGTEGIVLKRDQLNNSMADYSFILRSARKPLPTTQRIKLRQEKRL